MAQVRAAAALVCLALLAPAVAGAAVPVDPARWPAAPAADPALSATAHSIRFFGPDRFQTNLAAALALRGQGSFPFDSPDRSDGGALSLAESDNWWGARSCPRGVIVVAGDVFTDALAATSLSNPTGLAPGPLLERVAAADPLFDPPGAFVQVDLTRAPIIITPSGRQGARGLGLSARLAAQDLAQGGCTTARNAVIVGGETAVPKGVETDLLSVGYTQVFRVSGSDRFDTAARAALALGTAPIPGGVSGCASPGSVTGPVRMTWYAPSVVELREGVEQCRLLARTAVLADAGTGADALAAGWWTSFWQVPLLYTDAAGNLPAATANALVTLGVQNLIVLGGTSRIPQATIDAAVAASGTATAIRVAGTDRYDTSVQMAKLFGGWWPTGRAASFEQSMVCLAASSGNGASAVGWPDALAAGPWCAAANGATGNPRPPERMLAPADGLTPRTSAGGAARPSRDAVPVLLVPVGAPTLPASVEGLLDDAFVPGSPWCASVVVAASCVLPGFAVAFGGLNSVTESAERQAARLVSGGVYTSSEDLDPSLAQGALTNLDMSPVFTGGGVGGRLICFPRSAVSDARWLAAAAPDGRPLGSLDVSFAGVYSNDADGRVRSPGLSAPVCVSVGGGSDSVEVQSVSLSGRASTSLAASLRTERAVSVTTPIIQPAPRTQSGADGSPGLDGATSSWTYVDTVAGTAVIVGGAPSVVTDSAITLTIRRGAATASTVRVDAVAGSFSLTTSAGLVTGTFSAETLFSGGTWRIRGTTSLNGVPIGANAGFGGFRADLTPNGAGSADDVLTWSFDGTTP